MNKIIHSAIGVILFSVAMQGSAIAHDPTESSEERKGRLANQDRLRTLSIELGRSAETNEERAMLPRIINGLTITQDDENWQWTISLQRNGKHICGGTFVSPSLSATGDQVVWNADEPKPQWVLTAAHCLKDHQDHKYEVASGNVNIARQDLQKVEEVIVHSGYNSDTLVNDVALLKLKPIESVDAQNKRKSISIATDSDIAWIHAPYTALNVMGWGTTENGFGTQFLQRVRVPYVDYGTCSNAYSAATSNSSLKPGMICAGYSSGGFDSCQGDSGSNLTYVPAPRVAGPSNEPIVVGIVSWGEGCARPNLYGVYTSVLAFRSWMDETVKSRL